MASAKYVLAIDLGTSSGKVALISIHGDAAGWAAEPVPLHLLPNGGAEQEPQDWWNAIAKSARRLIDQRLAPVDDIVAVCASTQGGGTLPVDREGNSLMRSIIWLDSRAAEYVKQAAKGPLQIEGYDLFKLIRWLRLTGGAPELSGKDGFGHALYIKLAHPDVYRQTYKFLDVLDYINFRLTGQFVTSADSVVSRWITDNRDPEHVKYDEGLLKLSGTELDKHPEIRRCIDVLGPILPRVADELGLRKDVQVVTGAFDIPAAAIGSGAVADNTAHLYLGTSSWIAVHVPYKKTDISSTMASLPCAIPNRFLLMAAQEAAGVNLTWLRDNILYHQDACLKMPAPDDYFASLNAVAGSVPAGSHGLIYTPWLYGERAPVDDGLVRASVHNLSLENTRSDIARAVFEGVAYNSRWVLEPVERFCGRPMATINMVGGGAQSDLWCQIHADVLNRNIRQMKDPVMANARGAAFIAGVGLGLIRFEEVASHTQFVKEYQPNPENRPLYDERFGEFVKIYKQNQKTYAVLNRQKEPAHAG